MHYYNLSAEIAKRMQAGKADTAGSGHKEGEKRKTRY
jgi:hypothetical protein